MALYSDVLGHIRQLETFHLCLAQTESPGRSAENRFLAKFIVGICEKWLSLRPATPWVSLVRAAAIDVVVRVTGFSSGGPGRPHFDNIPNFDNSLKTRFSPKNSPAAR